MPLIPIITLWWQLLVLFVCCSGLGLCGRFLLQRNLSPLNKVLFSLLGGFFLVVLLAQNLVYLGVPVRISAWLLLAGALVRISLCRRYLVAWIQTCYSSADIRNKRILIFENHPLLSACLLLPCSPERRFLRWPNDQRYARLLKSRFLKVPGSGHRRLGGHSRSLISKRPDFRA